RKQSVTVLLKALGWTTEQILEEFGEYESMRAVSSGDMTRRHYVTERHPSLRDEYVTPLRGVTAGYQDRRRPSLAPLHNRESRHPWLWMLSNAF
ncbi:hypothetical protein, partial [Streptomyces pristinaespiralis]|uniref:hypothetical protein n=1 Tax=Streptomyces pristinaespiralis TaxID=38300 RepID=UPI0033C230D3